MLSHTPLGLGHPYRYEPDQRIPALPISGEPWKVRARTDSKTKSVHLYVRREDKLENYELILLGPAHADTHGPYGKTAKKLDTITHLTALATNSEEFQDDLEWEIELAGLKENEEISYWLENDTFEFTSTFELSASTWVADDGAFLKFVGDLPGGITAFNRAVLKNSYGQIFRTRFTFPLAPDDHIIGFGERFNSVDQRGLFLDAVVYEEYKGHGQRTYLPAPFGMVIGSDYGFYLKTSTPSRFDIGATQSDQLSIEIDTSPEISNVEIRTYAGPPISILNAYLSEFESPKNPPAWIYKLWGSSNEWNTQDRVEAEVRAGEISGVDLGVIVIEAWSDESTFTVFRDAQFAPTDGSKGLNSSAITYPSNGAWPNPKKMISDLHQKGIKVLLWQIPVIKEEGVEGSQINAIWNYALENNLVIRDGSGIPYRVKAPWFRDALLPDLTSPFVRRWWTSLREYLVTEMEVDGFKTDGGEHAWGNDLIYSDGRCGLEKNNLFANGYIQSFHDLLKSSNREGITFSRAGFAGSSSYPTFWAGDEDSTWEAFKASINAGISASASGNFFWGWDIAGFSGEIPTSELYLRGVAMATFCPIMQFHSEFNHHREPSNDRSPWNISERTGDYRVLPIFRKFLAIRNWLIPYLELEGREAITSSRPLMAGLFFDYAKDPEIWKVPSQYLLGRFLLVAPVSDPGCASVNVYLPEGKWLDFWDKTEHVGGKWIEVETPLDTIPVFIKSDSPNWLLNYK